MADLNAIFKAYDIRGVVPGELDESVAEAVGAAFVRTTGAKTLVTLHDMRPSSEPLADAVARETTLQWCRASEDYVRDSPLQLGGMHAGLQRNVRESVIDLGKLGRFGPPG